MTAINERAIYISSIYRETGVSECQDFEIRFNPSIKLDNNQKHEVGLDR